MAKTPPRNRTIAAPCGTWKSPITAQLIAGASVRPGDLQIDGQEIYWLESRPGEAGRNTIMRLTVGGKPQELLSAPFDARSRVHEYGGGSFIAHEGAIYFSNHADQQIYRLARGGMAARLTGEENLRYADFTFDKQRPRLIMVVEDHSKPGGEPENYLVSLDLAAENKPQKFLSGSDFYAFPRLSPDGAQLCWISWEHPNMPWDSTTLWIAAIKPDGSLAERRRIAGGREEAVFQPQWSPDGSLYFVSDRSGWWNIYRYHNFTVEPLLNMEAEFGLPLWVFNMSTYALVSPERLICAYAKEGCWQLASIDIPGRTLHPIETPYTVIEQLRSNADRAVFYGASPTAAKSLISLDFSSGALRILRDFSQQDIDRDYFSLPRPMSFPTADRHKAYGFFFPPKNPEFTVPENERPPLMVFIHGGPTAAAEASLNMKVQYWTSRGFAVFDVNYRGSTGYGRAYREQLNGLWGVADVEDCVNGARYLVQQDLVDRNRLIIRGGSAGGFTALAALTFHEVFQAGASYYGISDLEVLARETHKFEARYTDRLIGPYPEHREVYHQRSPLRFTEKLSAPIIFFQGLQDRVVLPDQAKAMVKALRDKKIPLAYVTFENEGHGFRSGENIKRSLENELSFYAAIFSFQPADRLNAPAIENLAVSL